MKTTCMTNAPRSISAAFTFVANSARTKRSVFESAVIGHLFQSVLLDYPPLKVNAAVARRKSHHNATAATADQIASWRTRTPGPTLAGNMNDAGPASMLGNGVNAAAFCMKSG